MTKKEKGITLVKWIHFGLNIYVKNGEKKSAGIMLSVLLADTQI